MVKLPVTFSATLLVPTGRLQLPRMLRAVGRWGRAPGTLAIDRGTVEVEIGRLIGRLAGGIVGNTFPIKQQQSPVVLVRCRGIPRALQIAVIVADGDNAVLAVLRPFSDRRLREALRTAGVSTEEVAASFNLGTHELLRRFPTRTL